MNDIVMLFGKHKGKQISEIGQDDKEYLEWLYEQDWVKDNLKEAIEAYV